MVLILRTMLRTMIYNFWYRHFTKSLNLQERLCDAFLSYESFLVINFTHPTKNHSQSPHSFDIIGSLVTPGGGGGSKQFFSLKLLSQILKQLNT